MKNISKEVPKEAEQISSNIRSYFTKEINDQIMEMSAKEMEAVMKSIVDTRYWIAILKYTSIRTPLLDSILRVADPTKDPHKISWTQGAMAGICDIETYVIDLNSLKVEEESGEEEGQPRTEGVIIG